MIEIEVDARSFGSKGTNVAVRLKHGDYHWVRTFNCGKISSNQAELKGVEFALKSIRKEFEKEDVRIKSTNRYTAMMLEKNNDQWVKKSRVNANLLEVVRGQYDRFNNVIFEHSWDLKELKELNTNVVVSGDQVVEKDHGVG